MSAPSRAGFLAVSAVAVGGLVAVEGARHTTRRAEAAPVHAPPLAPNEWDRAHALQCCARPADHRQVFQAESFAVNGRGDAVLFAKMQNSQSAFEHSMGMGSFAAMGVLMGHAVVFALDDAAWQRWNIGRVLALHDAHGEPVQRNAFDAARDGHVTAASQRAKGAEFFACWNTIVGLAATLGGAANASGDAVLADLKAHVLPGYHIVPAGVAFIQVAQDHGWRVYPIIG